MQLHFSIVVGVIVATQLKPLVFKKIENTNIGKF